MKKNKFVVDNIKKETEDIVTIFLSPAYEKPTFTAGQYVAVFLDEDKNNHAKFYTISSPPSDKSIALSVKKIGVFSTALHNLKVGDIVHISNPLGWFFPKEEADDLVFLAAGIGVTPFLSIIKDYENKNIKKQINIFYTNKTFKEIAFLNDMNEIAKKNNMLRIHYCLTRDKTKNKLITRHERINVEYIKKELGDLIDKNFYICGPISFVSDLRKQLLEYKVKEENIFTESFF